MGSGFAHHPQVEHLTIVEINPGYLPLIRQVPEVASLLQNPKVDIEIDDGRRWLIRNPDRKFDAIIMNTSHHWRSNASNLLSVEFLQLIRRHLNPGGVHFYNTTDSMEAMLTGVSVFPFGMRVANFLTVSDAPLQLDANRWLEVLLQYKIDGKPVLDMSRDKDRRRLREVMGMTATMDLDTPTPEFSAWNRRPYPRPRRRCPHYHRRQYGHGMATAVGGLTQTWILTFSWASAGGFRIRIKPPSMACPTTAAPLRAFERWNLRRWHQ